MKSPRVIPSGLCVLPVFCPAGGRFFFLFDDLCQPFNEFVFCHIRRIRVIADVVDETFKLFAGDFMPSADRSFNVILHDFLSARIGSGRAVVGYASLNLLISYMHVGSKP